MMKMKTNFILAVTAIFLLLLGIANVHAGAWCHNGTVTKTGVWPAMENETRSKYFIHVDCPAGSGDWEGELLLTMIPELGEAGYATALTAISTGQPVDIQIHGVYDWAYTWQIYLKSSNTP